MKSLRLILSMILIGALSSSSASAQQKPKLGDNAALHYWAAFAQMQDSAISDQQAKELSSVIDGGASYYDDGKYYKDKDQAPYNDATYKDLVEKNKPALETMTRATALANCDWGLDYRLGEDVPVDYVRKALSPGRLNVLYAFHLFRDGDRDGAVRALAAGLRFSSDVANGGSLFAAAVAKTLLVAHIRAVTTVLHTEDLPAAQRLVLHNAIARLGPDGLDWQSAAKRDLEALRGHFSGDKDVSLGLGRIIPAYLDTLNDPSMLPKLQQTIASVPQPLQNVIPSAKRVLDEKRDLSSELQKVRTRLY